jgi:HD-GYP domain-containing protein (c-di-GMP phosphodiesterase class II)
VARESFYEVIDCILDGDQLNTFLLTISDFFLHDLGKIKVDPAIINKEGKLTFDKLQAMRRHPLYGFNILNDAYQLTTECKFIILEHYEKEDGSGYDSIQKSLFENLVFLLGEN